MRQSIDRIKRKISGIVAGCYLHWVPAFPYTRFTRAPSAAFPSGSEVSRALRYACVMREEKSSAVFAAMIDTGSDYCIFPADLLDELGIDKGQLPLQEIQGMGEGRPTYFAKVVLWVQDLGEWEIDAGFSEYLRGTGSGILGMIGFLDRFKVTFDPKKQEAIVESV